MVERPQIPIEDPVLKLWAVVCDGSVLLETVTTDETECLETSETIASNRPGSTCRAVRFSSAPEINIKPGDAGRILGGLIEGMLASRFARLSVSPSAPEDTRTSGPDPRRATPHPGRTCGECKHLGQYGCKLSVDPEDKVPGYFATTMYPIEPSRDASRCELWEVKP